MTTMTEERLSEIEARAEAATDGPWSGSADDLAADNTVASPSRWVAETVEQDDAAFIAHARTDVPELIAEVRRLQASGTTCILFSG